MFSENNNINPKFNENVKNFLLKYIDFYDIADKFGDEKSEEIRFFLTYDCDELTDCYESPCFICFKPFYNDIIYLDKDDILDSLWDLGDEGTDKVDLENVYKKCLYDTNIISDKTFDFITTNVKGVNNNDNVISVCKKCWEPKKEIFMEKLKEFVIK